MDKIKMTEMHNYLENAAKASPFYMWGMDMEIITPARIKCLIEKYGAAKYPNWESKIGYFGSDCSGMLTPITGTDKTAQGYFNDCKDKGNYSNCKSNFCLVFNGDSKSEITHVGVLLGTKTYEMYNRLDIKPAKGGRWKFYGIPDFFEQPDEIENPNFSIKNNMCVVNKVIAGYTTAQNAVDHYRPAGSVQPGTYFIYKTDSKTGAINVTMHKGTPGSWIV